MAEPNKNQLDEPETLGVRTRLWGKVSDTAMGLLIAVGGVSTIIALLLVVMVLVATALPMLQPPRIGDWEAAETPEYWQVGVEENSLLMWGLKKDGEVEIRPLASPTRLLEQIEAPDFTAPPTCLSLSEDQRTLALGCADGTVLTARIQFSDELIAAQEASPGMKLDEAGIEIDGAQVFRQFDRRSIQKIWLESWQWSKPRKVSQGAIRSIDLQTRQGNELSFGASQNQVLAIAEIAPATFELSYIEFSEEDSFTLVSSESTSISTSLRCRSLEGDFVRCCLQSEATQAIVAWQNGTLDRFSISKGRISYQESQTCRAELESMEPMTGRQSFLCGTNDGRLLGWTIARSGITPEEEASDSDGFVLTLHHNILLSDSKITEIAGSLSSKIIAACDDQRSVSLVFLTADQPLEKFRFPGSSRNSQNAISLSSNNDRLVAFTGSQLWSCAVDLGHPEASVRSFLSRIWYEGHERPKYIWQSSSGSEYSETKLSLIPLVFGTLKATLWAMLFSVPLAIATAIYTSEFMAKQTRARIRPLLELLASLPGVVIGYLFAIVIAPILREHLATLIAGVLLLPFTYSAIGKIIEAPVMQTRFLRLRESELGRLFCLLACLPVVLVLATWCGQLLEAQFFGGDLPDWIAGQDGLPAGGWFLVLLPLFSLLTVSITHMQSIRALLPSHFWTGLTGVAVMLFLGVAVYGASWLGSWGGAKLGWDLRESLFNSYQENNSLLVGLALGLCVTPLIYMFAEDALQAVPASLRYASLACGASRWQTMVRVVLPAGLAGLVSAIMLGFARAIGETMIVLMVVGNAPLMEWNPFAGLRALTATLLTELPEATKGSTHYRTLFLAALMLFIVTLVVNTLAEFIRARSRRKLGSL